MLKRFSSRIVSTIKQVGVAAFSRRYLLATNVGVSVGLSGLGDLLQQRLGRQRTHGHSPIDTHRLRHMTAAGLPVGFICHYWYQWLDKYLPGHGLRVVAKKVVWDQLFLSPFMWLIYFAFLSTLHGNLSLAQIKAKLTGLGTQIYAAEWVIWPPAQVVNFYFLPTRFRVLYDNIISLGFDMYVSYLVHDQSLGTDFAQKGVLVNSDSPSQ